MRGREGHVRAFHVFSLFLARSQQHLLDGDCFLTYSVEKQNGRMFPCVCESVGRKDFRECVVVVEEKDN